MKIRISNPLMLLAAICTIIGMLYWVIITTNEDPTEIEIAIAGIYLLSSMLLWILAELIELNVHFSKMEEKDDQQDP